MSQPIHFNGLNGLRAIAVTAVLFSHTTQAFHSFGLDPFVFGRYADGNPKATLLAGFGVSIFFALSGFLITYLLLVEKDETGSINIKHFYARRILRIWPLYYAYLLASVLTAIIFGFSFEKMNTFYYLFLLANIPFIFGGTLPFLSHYWSLGVEEQFYSFWPWITKKKSVLKLTAAICIGLIVLKVVFRFRDIVLNQGNFSWPYVFIHVTRFHCMMIGAMGAILFFQNNRLFLKFTNNLLLQILSWAIIFLATVNKLHILSFIDNEFVAMVTVFLIMGQIQGTHRIINLDLFVFDFIGKISYGIYVIHPLIIFYLSKIVTFNESTYWLNYLVVYTLVLAVTIVTAFLSYHLFEKGFLKIKEKYSSRSSDVRSLKA